MFTNRYSSAAFFACFPGFFLTMYIFCGWPWVIVSGAPFVAWCYCILYSVPGAKFRGWCVFPAFFPRQHFPFNFFVCCLENSLRHFELSPIAEFLDLYITKVQKSMYSMAKTWHYTVMQVFRQRFHLKCLLYMRPIYVYRSICNVTVYW
jgi:hypothetical protein